MLLVFFTLKYLCNFPQILGNIIRNFVKINYFDDKNIEKY